MADKKPDPASQSFSAMVTEWERNFDAFANQVMGTDAYSQAMNEMQKAQLGYQRGFAEMMAQQLAAMNIPSREDVLQLSEVLRQVDRRLERIEEKMALNDKPVRRGNRPSRNRQPPAAKAEPATGRKTGAATKTAATKAATTKKEA